MKKLLAIAFIVSSIHVFACDHCNIFLNISPNDYRNQIGLYYRSRFAYGTYTSTGTILQEKHGGHGSTPFYWNNTVNDTYSSLDLRGKFYIKEKWQTFVSIPLVMNNEKINGLSKYVVNSIGDPWIVENYQVYNTKCISDSINFTQRITLGGGVKLPIGKINYTAPLGTPNLDLQPGTGSWDVLFTMSYRLKYKSIGLLSNINYKINGKNNLDYRYGKATNVTANAFYLYDLSTKIKVMPFVGTYLEFAGYDQSLETIQKDTGGYSVFGNLGLGVYFNKFNFNFQYNKVVHQNLNGDTQLFTNHTIQTTLNFNF